jgi:hypothetical protein
MIYYLSTRPETVVSIVKTGKLPNKLPSWAHVDYLLCVKVIADCFSGNRAPLHQIFILELDFPTQSEKSDDFMLLESLNTEFIKRIFVYSMSGNKLLNRLFKDSCSKPIMIEPIVYPLLPNQGSNSPLSDFFKENSKQSIMPDVKKIRTQSPISLNTIESKAQEKEINKIGIYRLGSYKEHIHVLKTAFFEAKKSILITSFSINHETLKYAELYELIPLATARGVRIYFYYNDQQIIDPNIMTFFKKHKVAYAETYTHSKILAVDKHFIAAGSFNWLSAINPHYPDNEEGSLCIRDGATCNLLIEEFWKYLKYYRSEQFGNIHFLDRFERNPDNMASLVCELDSKTELTYIPTLEEHCGFLQECFERAKYRIIICSPFISTAKEYKVDIDDRLLQVAISRGVDIYFVCSGEPDSLEDFSHFLDRLHSSKIHLISMTHIHLKTITVDEDTIAEGSFNWLSATRNRESDYHNHEQTLLVQGSGTRELIEHFFSSRIGEAVLNSICKKMDEQVTLLH